MMLLTILTLCLFLLPVALNCRARWQIVRWSLLTAAVLWGTILLCGVSAPSVGLGPADQSGVSNPPRTPAAPAVDDLPRHTKEEPLRIAAINGTPTLAVERLLAAMRTVESGGNDSAVGDGGRSLGPWQIQYPYYLDAVDQLEREASREDRSVVPARSRAAWRAEAHSAASARLLVLAYWSRYCPEALAAGDLETLARIHNGGPAGMSKASTVPYWNRVRSAM